MARGLSKKTQWDLNPKPLNTCVSRGAGSTTELSSTPFGLFACFYITKSSIFPIQFQVAIILPFRFEASWDTSVEHQPRSTPLYRVSDRMERLRNSSSLYWTPESHQSCPSGGKTWLDQNEGLSRQLMMAYSELGECMHRGETETLTYTLSHDL